MKNYLKYSAFLPYLNNEKEHDKYEFNKKKFSQINKWMMIEFSEDSMVYPPETAIFGSLDKEGNLIGMKQQ